jgi:hypothetical protein
MIPPMGRRLRLWAVLFVGMGVGFTLAGGNQATAMWLLVSGLVFAVASLVLDRTGASDIDDGPRDRRAAAVAVPELAGMRLPPAWLLMLVIVLLGLAFVWLLIEWGSGFI